MKRNRHRKQPLKAPEPLTLERLMRVTIVKSAVCFGGKTGRVVKVVTSDFGFDVVHVSFTVQGRQVTARFSRDQVMPIVAWEGNALTLERRRIADDPVENPSTQCVVAGQFDLVDMPRSYVA